MAEKQGLDKSLKLNKKYSSTNSLVLDSLTGALESSLPVVLARNSNQPPSTIHKKSSKLKLHDLLRPLSTNKSDSDESPTSPKRWHSPHLRRKRKARTPQSKSAGNSPMRGEGDSSTSLPSRLETTPVQSLPGQVQVEKQQSTTSMGVPTILVSPDEENSFELQRKVSQSSHLSTTSSIITSGAKDFSTSVCCACTCNEKCARLILI